MKPLLFTALALSCTAASAQAYKCPAEAGGSRLTNAGMQIGARHTPHALHGDVGQVKGGTNIRYNFPDGVPRWLVCHYGGKRVGGTVISGAEVIGGHEVRIALDPMVYSCDLAIREVRPPGRSDSVWTALATCQRREPPPPDML